MLVCVCTCLYGLLCQVIAHYSHPVMHVRSGIAHRASNTERASAIILMRLHPGRSDTE